jgi:uncharacterized membrane protein
VNQRSLEHGTIVPQTRIRWLLVAIIFLGTALVFHNLAVKSLRFDEIVQALVSALPIPRILVDVAQVRGQPPLYWVLLHFFSPLGRTEFAVRLLSALFGVVNIALIYRLAAGMYGWREGLVAAFLLATSPLHLKYAQDARMYSALVCFPMLSLYWLYRALTENKRSQWSGFVVGAVLGLWTHAYAGFVFGAEIAFAGLWLLHDVYRARRDGIRSAVALGRLRRFSVSVGIAFVAWVPVLISFRRLAERAGLDLGLEEHLSYLPQSFADLAELGQQYLGGSVELLILSGLLVVVGLASSWAGHKREMILLGLWVAVPAAGFYTLQSNRGFFAVRYAIYLLPLLLIAVGRGVRALSGLVASLARSSQARRFPGVIGTTVAVGVLTVVGMLTAVGVRAHYSAENENFRALASFLEQEVRPDDLLLTIVPLCEVHAQDRNVFTWYYGDEYQNLRRANMSLPELQDIVFAHPRTWVVGRRWGPRQLSSGAGAWIEGRFDQVAFLDFSIHVMKDSSDTWQRYRRGLDLVAEGDRLRDEGLLEEAASAYGEASGMASDLFAARLALAQVYERVGLLGDAAVEYRWVIDLEPDDPVHYLALAGVYDSLGEYDEAEVMRGLAEAPPSEDWATRRVRQATAREHFEKGNASLEQGELDVAVTEYQTAIGLDERLAGAHVRLGDVWQQRGQWGGALEEYIAALEYKPELGQEVWFSMRLANAYRETGRVEEATRSYEQVLAMKPDHAIARKWVEELCR